MLRAPDGLYPRTTRTIACTKHGLECTYMHVHVNVQHMHTNAHISGTNASILPYIHITTTTSTTTNYPRTIFIHITNTFMSCVHHAALRVNLTARLQPDTPDTPDGKVVQTDIRHKCQHAERKRGHATSEPYSLVCGFFK